MTTQKELITVLAREEMFAENCKIIDLRREYPGYNGEIFYAIATSYSSAELHELYSEFIEPYEPFILISDEEGKVMTEYAHDQRKYKMRKKRHEFNYSFIDGETEALHTELQSEDILDALIKKDDNQEMKDCLAPALCKLTEIQRKRIYQYFYLQMTTRQIARSEGVDHKAVRQSIKLGLKKLSKIIKRVPKSLFSVHSS